MQWQQQYSMHDTDSRIYALHKTDGDRGSLCFPPFPSVRLSFSVCSRPISRSPTLSSSPSVYICFASSYADNAPVMGWSKSKVSIIYSLSASTDQSVVEKAPPKLTLSGAVMVHGMSPVVLVLHVWEEGWFTWSGFGDGETVLLSLLGLAPEGGRDNRDHHKAETKSAYKERLSGGTDATAAVSLFTAPERWHSI
ncbi:unnamed protein product [Pleuronectes platessa]|uniref:Uncharacterized protein n=1 Tax=Pleuronectes platessa TaxID=8262 RepID=A0A9N7YDM4_PLEPL|nr:unnamed protein product [Pleuronectes platessa]